MLHGIHSYYAERARFERRTSLAILVVALVLLGGEWLLGYPPVRKRVAVIDPQRFGFEGPERYVRRILLESLGPLRLDTGREMTMVRQQAMKGGSQGAPRATADPAEPETRPRRAGMGDSPEDLVAMARSIYRSAPVVQSEDLVIERLVKPTYPEEARSHDIEGKVALIALVDTTGHVASVDIMASTGERQLEKAATEAVWQCLFRPYRVKGEVREVYAVFRFSFRIY